MATEPMKPLNEEELAAWVCGEASPQEFAATKARIEQDPAAARLVEEFGSALSAIATPMELPAKTSDDFSATLRHKWEAELAAGAITQGENAKGVWRSRTRRFARWAGPLAAAAVISCIILLHPGGGGRSADGLAWGQVVAAVSKVDHFHVTLFADEPRNAAGPTNYRLDFFYQRPGRFRAQGLDRVEFDADGKTQVYSIADGNFAASGSQVASQFFPPQFVKRFEDEGLLPAMVASMFKGDAPPGRPAKNTDAESAAGIEVFDYSTEPKNQWVRVWVLKESRLPIRMKVFHPESDDFELAEFDYSDPQPVDFFNADRFMAAARLIHSPQAQRFYAIGSEPVNGKFPRSSDQIHLMQGQLKSPEIKRVIAATNGDLVVITNSPNSFSPQGNSRGLDAANARDNWGNRYLLVAWWEPPHEGDQTPRTWYFTPLGDKLGQFQTGQEARILTMDFVTREPGAKLIATVSQSIPAADDAALPADVAEFAGLNAKFVALRDHMEAQHRPAAAQTAVIEQWLSLKPGASGALLWRFDLMLEGGHDADAWDFFQKQLTDRLLEEGALLDSDRAAKDLARYVFHLLAAGQDQPAHRILKRLEELKTNELASKHTQLDAQRLFESKYSMIREAMEIPQRLADFAAGPRPMVLQTLTDKTGAVAVEIQLTALPKWVDMTNPFMPKTPQDFWLAKPPRLEGADVLASGLDPIQNRSWIAFQSSKAEVTLNGTAPMAADVYAGSESAGTLWQPWTLKIKIPPPNVDSVRDWWKKQAPHASPWPDPPKTANVPDATGTIVD